MRSALRFLFLAACAASLAAPQDSPLIPPELFRTLNGEISGDIAYDHIRHLTLHHSPNPGSRGYRDKVRWIYEKARQAGLEDVSLIQDLPWRGAGWTPLSAELWITSPDNRRLASFEEMAVSIADYSHSGAWEGELVDVGEGTREADYQEKDVKGKIVLASGAPALVARQAVYQREALGVVYYNAARGLDHPDQVAWIRLSSEAPKGKETFAFSISYRAGLELKRRLAAGPAQQAIAGSFRAGLKPPEKITVRATVQAEFEENPSQWFVEARIRGTSVHDQAIVLTAHTQEEKFSANDDNSGCASLLEIGRAWTKLIREGKLPRPARDIRFWWANEISGEYAYFGAHPEERGRILVNLNQDMVGARQPPGARIQHITRTPDSRPSFLNDVVESIALLAARGNAAYLAAGQAGSRVPYSKPILAHFGSRDRYGVEIVPFFNNTDHMVFNDSFIGIPAVTLTNWPDPFIHSSDDDLWQVDPTQLQRNAFVVAATAVYLGSLEPDGLPVLASQVHTGARRTLSSALARAAEILALAAPAERDTAFQDGLNLVDQAAGRTVATLDSLSVFKPEPRVGAQLEEWKRSLQAAGVSLRATLAEHYRLLTGQSSLPTYALSEADKRMAAKVPERAVGVAEYVPQLFTTKGASLESLLGYETLNFVNGRRSYLDIYRAVRAEVQAAGEWYYGTVTAQTVEETLEGAVKTGLLRLKK